MLEDGDLGGRQHSGALEIALNRLAMPSRQAGLVQPPASWASQAAHTGQHRVADRQPGLAPVLLAGECARRAALPVRPFAEPELDSLISRQFGASDETCSS